MAACKEVNRLRRVAPPRLRSFRPFALANACQLRIPDVQASDEGLGAARMRHAVLTLSLAAATWGAFAVGALAAEPTGVTLTLKDHRFSPAAFTVPAGEKVRITLVNGDLATEEFDSHDLRVEQLVTPKGKISFSIGPLKPGEYSFMGEFHSATAQGKVTAVANPR